MNKTVQLIIFLVVVLATITLLASGLSAINTQTEENVSVFSIGAEDGEYILDLRVGIDRYPPSDGSVIQHRPEDFILSIPVGQSFYDSVEAGDILVDDTHFLGARRTVYVVEKHHFLQNEEG